MNRFRKLVGLTVVGPRQINIVAPSQAACLGGDFRSISMIPSPRGGWLQTLDWGVFSSLVNRALAQATLKRYTRPGNLCYADVTPVIGACELRRDLPHCATSDDLLRKV